MYKYCSCKTCRMFRRDLEFNNTYGAKPRGEIYESPFQTLKDYFDGYKGKDNNMTTVTIDFNNNRLFNVEGPKFDTGTKIKFWNGLDIKAGVINWKQGVIYSLNKKVTISKSGSEKEFKADKLQWFYTIIENGNLKTWNGIKEEYIKIDDTPDYNKYFDFLDKQGVKLDRTRYTWKKFVQTDCIKYVNYYYGSANPHAWETEYLAVLCDKSTKKNVEFKGTQVGTDKLPAISEKC